MTLRLSRTVPLVLIALWLAVPARAQQGEAVPAVDPGQRYTVYLPTGHPSYPLLERMRGAGLLTGSYLNLDQRPLSRLTMARALLVGTGAARERGLGVLVEAGEWLLREFAREVALIHRSLSEEEGEGGATGWRAPKGRMAAT